MGSWQEIFNMGCRNLFEWGPGLLLAIVILYGLYKMVLRLGQEVGIKIIGALEKPAAALNQQAESMDRLTNSIQEYVSRDQTEHKEMILLLKVISNKVNRIEDMREGKSGS